MAANVHTRMNCLPFMPPPESRSAERAAARWGIVLAGGEGTRMRPPINYWFGAEQPKQYCTFVGSRSMFQHTVDRAHSVVSEKQLVTVIGRGHRKFLAGTVPGRAPGLVIEQPRNLGTAPGVFLPTAYVLAHEPEATVLLFPSDHFVHPEDRFCDYVNRAFELAENYRDQIILVGAIPNRAETDYGWIAPVEAQTNAGDTLAGEPKRVMRFREKPDVKEARVLLRQGGLWNTMVMAVKAKTLWTLGRQCMPEMMYTFDAFLTVLRAIREKRLAPSYEACVLTSIYKDLAPADLSRDLIAHVSERCMVLPMDGVDWCDWGRPQRVAKTLAKLGHPLSFPTECSESELKSGTLAAIATIGGSS